MIERGRAVAIEALIDGEIVRVETGRVVLAGGALHTLRFSGRSATFTTLSGMLMQWTPEFLWERL